MAVRKTASSTRKRSSTRTKIDFMKATNSIGKPIAAVAGFAGGKYLLKKLEKSPTVSGLLGNEMKGYVIPGVITLGGLVGTQFTKNPYFQLGLVGVSGAGVESMVKKATGKTLLQGLEGLLGDEEFADYEDMSGLRTLNPVTQALPAANINLEREINKTVSGIASDYAMSDDPIGSVGSDYAMSDEPIGGDYINERPTIGRIQEIDPDTMDFDVFAGDMMAS